MRKFGLIGYPLGHSFSRKYFSDKFSREHLNDCSYENFPLESLDMLPGLICSEDSLCGLNVTIPFKTEVLRFLDITDPEAAEVGAVNVIKIRRAGDKCTLSGFNSDITGIRHSLQPLLRPDVRMALILGTGGGSKAVHHVLSKTGITSIPVSRYPKPGCIIYSEITPDIMSQAKLIINTTPLGMYPDVNSSPELNYDLLDSGHILFDLVYNPPVTMFLKKGQERGCKILNGLEMLISQAEKSWDLWNDESV